MMVTITGANGFIGHHLVQDQLARGRHVRAVDLEVFRLQRLPQDPGLELIQADIRDTARMQQAVDGAEVVFHLGSAHLSVTLSDEAYWDVNCAGSKNLVALCHRAGVGRFVHCSSVGVHGEIHHPPATEEAPCHPDVVYEQSKWAGELAVRQYAEETGLPLVVVRPVWVYGPGCPRTAKLFRMLKKRRFFFAGNGQTLRHCIHISDLVAAFDLCAHHPHAVGQVFIIGDEAAVTIRELMRQMAAAAQAPEPKLAIPLWVCNPLCWVLEQTFTLIGKEPPLSRRSLKFFTNNTSFDISRARHELGFRPNMSLPEGLRVTYEALQHVDTETHLVKEDA